MAIGNMGGAGGSWNANGAGGSWANEEEEKKKRERLSDTGDQFIIDNQWRLFAICRLNGKL